MAGVTFTMTGATQAQYRIRAAAGTIRQEQLRAMRLATATVERHVKAILLSGSPRSSDLFGRTGASPPSLGAVSGHLRRSVTSATFSASIAGVASVVGTVGTPLVYARIHEEGGTITGNPWLRIPTKYAKTRAGLDRLSGVSARGDPNLFVVKSKAGNLWLVKMRGVAAKARLARASARALIGARAVRHRGTRKFWPGLIPMYLLVHSVRIPKRAPFAAALKQTRAQVLYILRSVAAQVAASVRG